MFPDLRQIYRRSFISHTNRGLGPHTGYTPETPKGFFSRAAR